MRRRTTVGVGTIDVALDRRLVEAWQHGEEAAFDELYRLHFDRLRAFCQRRVGNRVDAEEITQEAFAKALQALPRFGGDRRFYPWMTVIAARLCTDHHRRRARVSPSDEVDPGVVDDGHDERLALQADLDHLDRALRRLTPRHADVLDLRERRGLSYDEIAGELGVPHSTVETLLFRARRALRREFEKVAGAPAIVWVAVRIGRLRQRGIDINALATPIAAGAMTAMFALPGAAAPAVAVAAGSPHRAVVAAPTMVVDGPAPAGTPATTPPTHAAPTRPPAVRPMDVGSARNQVSTMPVQLQLNELQLGAGLDPQPLLDRLPSGRSQP